jgi:hypothetical protein
VIHPLNGLLSRSKRKVDRPNGTITPMSVPVLPRVPEPAEVLRELELILGSSVFRGSKRCQDFLRYVATKVLEGEAGVLKERTLAIEVFGRSGAADLGDDSIVRVGAREVRKRLAQYYVTEGARDLIRIELPAGSYVPLFNYYGVLEDAPAPATPADHTSLDRLSPAPEQNRRSALRTAIFWAVLIAALAASLAISLRIFERKADPFQLFWAPALNAGSPLLVVLPEPIVYHPSPRAMALDRQRHGDPAVPVQRAIDVPPKMLDGNDFIPVLDQYVGFGDALAGMRISSLLQRYARVPKFRLASKVEFTDLRDSTPILIGAYTNHWAMETTRNMRYRFVMREGNPGILNTQNGQVWSLRKQNDGRSAEDYVLICRLPHSETGEFMMLGAGINMSGTEEAGSILTDSQRLDPILRKLPSGWETSNLELILHVDVIGDAPAMPRAVASYIWK